MPYLVKSRSRNYKLRDGDSFDDPVYLVTSQHFVIFNKSVPGGVEPPGDGEIEVKWSDDGEGGQPGVPIEIKRELGSKGNRPAPASPAPAKLSHVKTQSGDMEEIKVAPVKKRRGRPRKQDAVKEL